MMHFKKIYLIFMALLAVFFLTHGPAAAVAADKTLTVGAVSGDIGATVAVPIKIDDASGVGGITFTLTYFPTALEFKGLEQGGRVITDGANPTYTTDEIKNNLFYQVNDEKTATGTATGRLMIAAASAQALTGTNVVLLNAKFQIKAGANGAYPIKILQTIIQNANAGYPTPTLLPVLVGTTTPNAQGMYTETNFPVYGATLVAGSVTVNAPKFNIAGNVTYGTGGPAAAGSTVTLRRNTAMGYVFDAQTTVGATGNYSFTGKPAGTYQVFVTSNDPGYYNAQSASFDVSANYTVATIALPAPQRLSGNLTINGTYLPGLQVKVMNGQTVVGVYAVNSNGSFQTAPLPPGTYDIYAIYGNLVSPKLTGDYNWQPTLQSIGGTLTGLTSGATVMASSVAGNMQKTKTVTASDVNYTISNLVPANDYIVSVVGAGLPVTYYNGTTDITSAVAVNISSGDKTDANFDFTSVTRGFVSGIVTNSPDSAANMGVYAFDTVRYALTSVLTDGSGAYNFTLAPGDYEIFVIKANGKIFYYGDGGSTQSQAAATVLHVLAGEGNALPGKNIDVSECTNVLTGYVTYKRADGDPAANVLVAAVSTAGKAIALTGENGAYSMSGLCPADYRVEMNPLNAKYAIQTATVTVPGTASQNFVIDTGNVLSGKVTDSLDGAAVGNAMLYLTDQETGSLVNGRMYFTNDTGDYIIADIAAGVYTLNITHPLYRSYGEGDVSITTDLTKDIQLVKGAYFDITVTDGDSLDTPQPGLAGVLVIVTRAGAVPVYAMTNSNGNTKIFGFDASKIDYMIMVQKTGFDRKVEMPLTPSTNGTVVAIALKRPAQLFSLSGKITTGTAEGPAVPGAYVLVSSTGKNFFASTTTAANGQYSFTNLPQASDYRFVVVPGGNLRTYVDPVRNFTDQQAFTKDVVLPSGSAITGTVTRTGTAAINVFLYTAANKFVAFTTADANGGYTFTGLTSGNYKVLAVSAGNKPKWYGGSNSIGLATAVSAGEPGINIELAP